MRSFLVSVPRSGTVEPPVFPDPDAGVILAARYGTLQQGVFVPAVPAAVRVRAALANGVPPGQARLDIEAALVGDELRLRTHGLLWQLVVVRATDGNGQGEVSGVDSSDPDALAEAQLLAQSLAAEDQQSWRALGLADN